MKTTDFAVSLERYLSHFLRHERGLSHNTIASYAETFVLFIDYMESIKKVVLHKLHLSHITRDNVLDFLHWLSEVRGYDASSRNSRLATLRSFSKYMQHTDITHIGQWQAVSSINPVKATAKTANHLSVDAIKLLLAQPDMTTRRGRRHLAILSLLYDSGARVQEIADLLVKSVRTDGEYSSLQIVGKGGKARVVPLMSQQAENLKKYMCENGLNAVGHCSVPLFTNVHGQKLTRAGITYMLHTYVEMARKESPELFPERVSCHTIRHSKAMHLVQAGVNIVYIRDFLGHASIQTTDRYARADSKAKREALEKAYADTLPDGASKLGVWEKDKSLRDWLNSLKK